jgi:hypothetical protein
MYRGEIVIDGYNLVHAAGLARPSYGPGDLERCRHQLLQLLAGHLTTAERDRTTVVFDARAPGVGPSYPFVFAGMTVIFADDGDADTTIEHLISACSAPRRLCVVSSDRRLQRAAGRRRSAWVRCDQFVDELVRRSLRRQQQQRTAEPPEKHGGPISAGEIERWLQTFQWSDTPQPLPPPPGVPGPRPVTSSLSDAPDPQTAAAGDASSNSPQEPATSVPEGRSLPSDELTFWEARISELSDERSSRKRPASTDD